MSKAPSRQKVYPCDKCGFEYAQELDAFLCSQKPIEDIIFAVGDCVRLRTPHRCKTPLLRLKEMPAEGTVTQIKGPIPPDEEYENKYVRIPERLRVHVYAYVVEFACGRCQQAFVRDCYLPDVSAALLH